MQFSEGTALRKPDARLEFREGTHERATEGLLLFGESAGLVARDSSCASSAYLARTASRALAMAGESSVEKLGAGGSASFPAVAPSEEIPDEIARQSPASKVGAMANVL